MTPVLSALLSIDVPVGSHQPSVRGPIQRVQTIVKIDNDIIRSDVLIEGFQHIFEGIVVEHIQIAKFCLLDLIIIGQLTSRTRDDLSTEFIVACVLENIVFGDFFHQVGFGLLRTG